MYIFKVKPGQFTTKRALKEQRFSEVTEFGFTEKTVDHNFCIQILLGFMNKYT
jgi:hypothetical protein